MDPHRDYEPAMVSNPLPGIPNPPHYLDMERFGFFEQGRVGFDPRQATILDTERVHWASRHNLWVWHHALFTNTDAQAAAGAGCNSDRDCQGDNVTCRIGDTPRDATHRGTCQAMVIHHLPAGSIADADIACQTDTDCMQTSSAGVSRSAVCDQATHTCGEHYLRCSTNSDCTDQVGPHSYCDLAIAYNRRDTRGLCTMPFRQRQVRQIAYHETENYPSYM